jgi:RNase P subunit RPR2
MKKVIKETARLLGVAFTVFCKSCNRVQQTSKYCIVTDQINEVDYVQFVCKQCHVRHEVVFPHKNGLKFEYEIEWEKKHGPIT